MFYYRYRPYTETSIKELLYNEMYFSSPEECNDPFDSKTFYAFDNNREMWGKLLKFSVAGTNAVIPEKLLPLLTEHICTKCPLTFDEAHKTNLLVNFPSIPKDKPLTDFVGMRVQDVLRLYKPATRYFVSFSKKENEPLMWSHYADKHKGFCLVFRAINGAIFQSSSQKKHAVIRETKNGLGKEMSYGMPDSFPLTKIDYEVEVKPLNAFLHLPIAVTDEKQGEEAKRIMDERESHYIQKSKGWEYEAEYRLMLPPPIPWLFGDHFDYTKQERLFHYQPSQLVGIIYGARMEEAEKNRIKELLRERRDWRDRSSYQADEKTIEFSFIEYDAVLSPYQREVLIKPTGMQSYKTIPPTDPNFDRLRQEMLDGWAWERTSNSSKKIKVD